MTDSFDYRKSKTVASSDRKNYPLSFDAWHRPKAILDFSLIRSVFVPEIPRSFWIEEVNMVEQTAFVNFSSSNGMLKCSGVVGQQNFLMSKRHPRYQPNRGHLFSASMFLPSFATVAIQEFGLFHHQAGVFFRAVSSKLYAVKKNMLNGVISEIVEEIFVPNGMNLTKGNNYDIQFQWRGVGDILFFINDILVHKMILLGTLSEVSVFNPALPVAFQITGDGIMYCGCVDVSSEGGDKGKKERGFLDSGELPLTTLEIPIMLLHIPNAIGYNGFNIMNTKDVTLQRATAYSDSNTLIKVYVTRNSAKFAGTTFTNYDTLVSARYAFDGSIVLVGGVTGLQKIATKRVSANTTTDITNPDPTSTDFILTHGDYLLVTLQAKNNSYAGATLEWATEI